ncbi:class I SAM-dependent methyltransferase [Chloroflexota bacterium]
MRDLANFYDERYKNDYMRELIRGNYEFRRYERIKYLLSKVPLSQNIKVLDYGCGQGRYTGVLERVFPDAEIDGCDISKIAVEKARNRFPKHQFLQFGEITPYGDNTFDFILSIEVFEHVEDIYKTIKDISRILKIGGYLLFSTPCGNPFSFEYLKSVFKKDGIRSSEDGFRSFYFEDVGHLRRLKSGEISAILKNDGMEEVYIFFDCPFLPIVYIIDILSWLEWVLFKKLPNGSGMFGVFEKT